MNDEICHPDREMMHLSNRLMDEAKDYLLISALFLTKRNLILFYRSVGMGHCCMHSINITIVCKIPHLSESIQDISDFMRIGSQQELEKLVISIARRNSTSLNIRFLEVTINYRNAKESATVSCVE